LLIVLFELPTCCIFEFCGGDGSDFFSDEGSGFGSYALNGCGLIYDAVSDLFNFFTELGLLYC